MRFNQTKWFLAVLLLVSVSILSSIILAEKMNTAPAQNPLVKENANGR